MLDNVKEGFLAGCDDYIKKPFDIDELILRIKNILKRQFNYQNDDIILLNNEKNIYFNLIDKTLYENNRIVNLTNKEKDLLALLLKHRPNFVNLDVIFKEIWNFDEEPIIMSLRVYIKNLRKILGKESIINQRNIGYALKI